MINIKSYTDIEQSRKLAEILPLESADMYYLSGDEYDICFGSGTYEEIADWFSDGRPKPADVPCWSIGALIDILPRMINHETLFIEASPSLWNVGYRDKYTARSVNLIDACYEMILYLHELNLLCNEIYNSKLQQQN